MSGFKLIATATLAGLVLATHTVPAIAQDAYYNGPYYEEGRYPDESYDYRGDYLDEDEYGHRFAGRQIARDYITGVYYDYPGTPPRDPRVGEQDGWRNGVVRTPPRWHWRRCGCSRLYNGGRWYSRPQIYDHGAYDYSYRNRLDRRTSYEYRWPSRNW